MTDDDGFRLEAAEQFGFKIEPGRLRGERYACTELQLLAFAKSCERKGLATARKAIKSQGIQGLVDISVAMSSIDADITPVLEAERARGGGYVAPDKDPA